MEILPPIPFVYITAEHQAWLPVFHGSFPLFHTHLCARSLQLCPTLCDPTDYSLPGSSVHGILQARILECVAIPSSRETSPPRDRTCVSCIFCIGMRFLYHWRHLGSPHMIGRICQCNFPNSSHPHCLPLCLQVLC